MMVVALLSVLAIVPAAAQDEEGGIIIDSTFGTGPDTFSQIYCTDTACSDMVGLMYIGLVGVDPVAAQIVPGASDALATDWSVSEDNLVYTFNLRDDFFWSDGEQINADDVLFHWDLVNNPDAQHPDAWLLDVISSVEKIDDFTVEFTFPDPSCTSLNYAGGIAPIPSHYLSQFDVTELETIDFNFAPDITSASFTFGEWVPGQTASFIGNDSYVDATNGFVAPDGLIQVVSADQTVQVEQLLAGEINMLRGAPVNRRSDLRASDEVNTYEYPGNSWDYVGLNLADPTNPQPALDEDGNRIEQGAHPVFGDKMVRQALAHAIDVPAIIESAVFGEGQQMTAHITPSSWAYIGDEALPPRAFDPELALSMLAEAGWTLDDSGALVNADGEQMAFELLTNAGNTRREAIGTVIQDQLGQIGIEVDFATIDFNALLDVMDSQAFDAFILGWRAGYPDDPNTVQLFGAEADVPGSGFNFTSFYNERFFELEAEANAVPGCAPEDRAPLYAEMQEIMQDEMPYLWLFVQNGFYAARTEINGFAPEPSQMVWNLDTWTVSGN
jgi:peptide/nickel transport system substrate-binding protein